MASHCSAGKLSFQCLLRATDALSISPICCNDKVKVSSAIAYLVAQFLVLGFVLPQNLKFSILSRSSGAC